MTDLNALIERLSRATGADRELDVLVHEAAGLPFVMEYWSESSIEQTRNLSRVPQYTRSIDAAVTLVPEKLAIRREWLPAGSWPARCYIHKSDAMPIHNDEFSFKGLGRTEAISICIAALSARTRTARGESGAEDHSIQKERS